MDELVLIAWVVGVLFLIAFIINTLILVIAG
jgi:hypothetical protein